MRGDQKGVYVCIVGIGMEEGVGGSALCALVPHSRLQINDATAL